MGHIDFMMENTRIIIPDVLYVPQLQSNLFSVQKHIEFQGCTVFAISRKAIITFDQYIHEAEVNETIHFLFKPTLDKSIPIGFNGFTAQLADTWVSENKFSKINQINLLPECWSNALLPDITSNVTSFTVVKTSPYANIPKIVTPGSAGHDITAIENAVLKPHSRTYVPTGLKFNLPLDIYAESKPRSGLAKKHNISVHNGVIDSDFRGELHILMYNNSSESFTISTGDWIAQMIFASRMIPTIKESNIIQTTERNTGGFGSTGMKPLANEATIISQEDKDDTETNHDDKSNPVDNDEEYQYEAMDPDEEHYTEVSFTEETQNPQDVHTIPLEFDLPHSMSPEQAQHKPPSIRPVDRAFSSSRNYISISPQQLYQSFAYRNIDNIIKHLPTIAKDTISISKDPDKVIPNSGQYATIHKSRSNKKFKKYQNRLVGRYTSISDTAPHNR